jgi:hypothetical protein
VLRGSVVSLALALASCASARGGPPPIDPTDTPEPASGAVASVDVQELARDVARIRHLELRAPIVFRALPSAEFVSRLESTSVTAESANDERTDAFWQGFGFITEGGSARAATHRVLDAHVSGFYDSTAKQLFLRDMQANGGRVILRGKTDRQVLVHEIEHALQDQVFGLPARGTRLTDDQALALRAVFEGDAMLTMIADEALHDGSPDHWVSRVTRFVRARSAASLVRMGEHSPELLAAPPLVQKRVLFPYVDGLTLMADVYRAGGVPLVDRVFLHPLVSTEQVLHPDRYVEGDAPVPVAPPAAPEGARVVSHGTMGELQTGVLLGQCMAPGRGEEVARGWGGDAYAVVLAHDSVSLLWSTVWDDEASAERFERAARDREACMARWDPDPHVGRSVLVVRDGVKVAYVQGLDAATREAAARALLALPGAKPAPSQPLGAVVIPPLVVPEEVFAHHGEVTGGFFESHLLGMRAIVPPSFEAAGLDARSGFEILVKRTTPSFALAGFQFVMSAATKNTELEYLRAFMNGLKKLASFARIPREYLGQRTALVGTRTADVYAWGFPRGGLRVAFAPACRAKATVAVVSLWIDEDGHEAVDAFRTSIVLPADDAQVCAYLAQVVD